MAIFVDVVKCCLQAGLRLKSVGVVQRSAGVWRCSAFIAWTGWTHAMTLSHDDSTINIIIRPVIIIIIIIIIIILKTVLNSVW